MRLAIRTCFAVSPYAPQGWLGLLGQGPGALKVSHVMCSEVSGPGSFWPAPPPPPGARASCPLLMEGQQASPLGSWACHILSGVMLTRLAVALVPGGTAWHSGCLHTSLQNSGIHVLTFFSGHQFLSPKAKAGRASLWAGLDGGVGRAVPLIWNLARIAASWTAQRKHKEKSGHLGTGSQEGLKVVLPRSQSVLGTRIRRWWEVPGRGLLQEVRLDSGSHEAPRKTNPG